MKNITRRAALLAAVAGTVSILGGCASKNVQVANSDNKEDIITNEDNKYIIGVPVYDITDDEVIMMRNYLEEYIAGQCFDNVKFVYSETLMTSADCVKFIQDVAELGGKAILAKFCVDLAAEVAAADKAGMYYTLMSGTVTDDAFSKAKAYKKFLGVFGPGSSIELQAGKDMAAYFAGKGSVASYLILSGGAGSGNAAHLNRTKGMIQSLNTACGTKFDAEKLAAAKEATTVDQGGLSLTVCPGYTMLETDQSAIRKALSSNSFDCVMSAMGIAGVADDLKNAKAQVGAVDCYSQNNQILFAQGKMQYLSGKYGSLIGPAFATIYNAVTGHADVMRDNGSAFRITQGFWTSKSSAEFNDMYAYSSNPMLAAYSFEDLASICVELNSKATLADVKKLAEAYSFEDVKARRAK